MTASEICDHLARTWQRLAPLREVDRDTESRSYAPGKWTARQILAHLADTDLVFFYRFLKAAAEEGSAIVPFDENVWAEELRIDARPVGVSLAMIQAVHEGLAHHLKTLPPARLERASHHPEKGPMTPLRIAKVTALHTEHHLRQLDAIRNRTTWTKAEAIAYYA